MLVTKLQHTVYREPSSDADLSNSDLVLCESKCEQLSAKCGNFDYMWSAKHIVIVIACEKYRCCLKS
jgi:hypothetical protein